MVALMPLCGEEPITLYKPPSFNPSNLMAHPHKETNTIHQ